MTALTAIRTHLAGHRARRAARDDIGGRLRAVVADRPVARGAK